MIHKFIVNAAFLAVGYYIGKEVAKKQYANEQQDQPAESSSGSSSEDQDQGFSGKDSPTIN